MVVRTFLLAESAAVLTTLIAARIGTMIACRALRMAEATTAPFTEEADALSPLRSPYASR
ncbi:MAG: hypothetical protein AAGC55_01430 [Myxococcota bacterium]